MSLSIEALDNLDDKMQELDSFGVPLLAEAIAENDRCVGIIRRLIMCKPEDQNYQVEQLIGAVSEYFHISDEEQDDAKSVYDREARGDHQREIAKAA